MVVILVIVGSDSSAVVADVDAVAKKADKGPTEAAPLPLPFFSLYRYATPMDRFLMIIGLLSAIIQGGLMPG